MLLEKIKADLKAARVKSVKEKCVESKEKVDLLKTLIGELESNAKRDGSEITDEKVLALLKKFIKGCDETIHYAMEDGMDESGATLAYHEKTILESYMPQQMTEEQLRKTIGDIISLTGAESMKEMGKVMGGLKNKYDGQYDGGVASKIVKELLA